MRIYNLKYNFSIIIYSIIIALSCQSCEDFLDKSPDDGLTEDDVYKDYASMRGYMDQAYNFLENFHAWGGVNNERTYIGAISDELASLYNWTKAEQINSGNWLVKEGGGFEIGCGDGTSIKKCYNGIRVVNRVIRDIDRVPMLTDNQKNELLGQSYFLRGWFYFQLMKRYGGMPILDTLFQGDGDEDIPRKTYHESHDWLINENLEPAIRMLPDVWDDMNTGRPNKLAAMALKSMAQLYDASPLMQNNLEETKVMDYDTERAKIAAQSAYAVLEYIKNNGTECDQYLMPKESYKNIFYFKTPPFMQPEYIWYNRTPTGDMARYLKSFWLPEEYVNGGGVEGFAHHSPTQNMVDLYEKKGPDGNYYPISMEEAAYDPNNPFETRDPRFNNNILYPGSKWGKNKQNQQQYITTYVGGSTYESCKINGNTNKREHAGYICKKFIWEEANSWKGQWGLNRVITVYIRVAQIYLDFAEASFEATGSATAKVDGCDMSAVEALNIIRQRAGITDVPEIIYSDPAKFREAYRRERAVELMFENHRWWDIRRWMIAHELFKETSPIKGLRATPVDPNHAQIKDKSTLKFKYEIVPLKPELRVFEMRNYWYPFTIKDVASLKNLKQNPGW